MADAYEVGSIIGGSRCRLGVPGLLDDAGCFGAFSLRSRRKELESKVVTHGMRIVSYLRKIFRITYN
jgi:hypothetical protein